MTMPISIRGIPQLQAAARAFADAPAATRKAIQTGAKEFSVELQREVSRRASGPIENAVAASGRVAATNKGLTATFGGSGTYHGVPLRRLARPFEWGGNRERFETYISRQRTSRAAMQVTRRAQRQIPPASRRGRFVAPAATELTPRFAARWAELIATEVGRGH